MMRAEMEYRVCGRLGVGCRGTRYFFDADGLDPFGDDDVAIAHHHPGVFVKHLRASTSAPSEELQKVISTHGLCAGRGIGFGLAIGNTAVGVLHGVTLLRGSSMPVAIRYFQAPRGPAVRHNSLFMSVGCL